MGFDRRSFLAAGAAALVAGCQRNNRGDLVVDSSTGRMYGMRSDGQPVFTDPAMYPNRRLKLSLRNMSGDAAWDLDATRDRLYQAFLDKGYERSDNEDFGLKVDLNILRSQQYDASMSYEYAFLGAVAGGAIGANAVGGAVASYTGMAVGASLGAIAGTFATDHIYVVITEATFGVRRNSVRPRRVVTFEGSPRIEEWEETAYGSFHKTQRVRIANYGGGREVTQREIADDIRARMMRSLTSFI